MRLYENRSVILYFLDIILEEILSEEKKVLLARILKFESDIFSFHDSISMEITARIYFENIHCLDTLVEKIGQPDNSLAEVETIKEEMRHNR